MRCPICDSEKVDFALKIDKVWDIYGCSECLTQFVCPMPTQVKQGEAQLGNLNNPYYGWLTFQRQKNIITGLTCQNHGRILDFGCGGGHFLYKFGFDWFKYGIEISKEARAVIREVAWGKRIRVFATLEEAGFADEYFDVVVMFATIEHLPNPKEVVKELCRVLKVGGLFVVMTGDVTSRKARVKGEKWHMYCLPEHLFFFSAYSIDCLMDGLGMKKVKSLYTDGGMNKIPFLDIIPILKRLPLFDHYYGYYVKEATSE